MWFQKRIYADAAAAMPVSRAAMREYLRLEKLFGNPGGLHRESVAAKMALEAARKRVAETIGAHTDEIIFTASGTEANNLAIAGVLRPRIQKGGAQAITSAIEHQSVLEPLRALTHEGLAVRELPVDQEGMLFSGVVREAVTPDTVLVSVQMVNSEVGVVQPVREIAKELHRVQGRKIYFHTDAAQAPLWLDIKVERLGVDLLSLDGQKFGAPKGIGVLYVRRGTPLEPILFGGGQERGIRSGTENVALAGAFAVALTDAQKGVAARVKRVAARREYLWKCVREALPAATLNGPALHEAKHTGEEKRVANNLNVSIPGLDAQMAVISLDVLGVAAATRSACSAGEEEPSHVLRALGLSQALAGTTIRFTLLSTVTRGQCRRIARALKESAQRYGKPGVSA